MSHFSSIKTVLKDRSSLISALEAILHKINPNGVVEVHEKPTLLINNYDKHDRQYAHLIIRSEYLGTSNRKALIDIGFLQDDEGVFQLKADSWDFNHSVLGKNFSNLTEFLNEVQMQTEQAFIKAQYPVQDWSYQTLETLGDGSIRMVITKRQSETLTTTTW